MFAEKRDPLGSPDENLGRWILGGVVLLVLAGGGWYWQNTGPKKPRRRSSRRRPRPPRRARSRTRSLRPTTSTRISRPPSRSRRSSGRRASKSLLVPDDFVKKVVATVDSLARQDVAARMNPAKPLAGEFATAGEGDAIVSAPPISRAMHPGSSSWIRSMPTRPAALYKRLYPQLQAAYENLGNPDSYFNDRVIEVIDHLLSAPEAPATITLVRPNVLYEFADPALEAESAGQAPASHGTGERCARESEAPGNPRPHRGRRSPSPGFSPLEDLGLHASRSVASLRPLRGAASHPAHPAGAELPGRLSPVDHSCGFSPSVGW